MSKLDGMQRGKRLLLVSMGLIAALSLAVGQDSPGQPSILNSQPLAVTQPESPRFLLKNGTSSLLDPIAPSFNLAIEYRLAGRFYAHAEGGPLLPFRYFAEPTTDNLHGYRLRGALRYYVRPPQAGAHAAFVELLYTYQETKARIEGDFFRDTPSGTFGQRFWYDFQQQKQGGYLNAGIQQIYPNGFLFETGFGLGALFRDRRYGAVPPDAIFHTNGSFIWQYNQEDLGALMGVMVYVNLGYAF
ncbi:MAG: hypothetical protein KDD02_07740 [Phaeodactylibacter sp.]|nr:hypothetical protein [Phaeodactylibacter sp.]